MEAESITKKHTRETSNTIQQQFQYFKASPSQLRSKLFTTVIFSCSSQIHSSLEGQQGASETRYQTFSNKQTTPLPIPLSLLPHTHLASHIQQHSCTLCSPSFAWGVVLIFFLIAKDFKQHFPQQERIPIQTDELQCLMTGANHTTSLMNIAEHSSHPPCLTLPRQEQHPQPPPTQPHLWQAAVVVKPKLACVCPSQSNLPGLAFIYVSLGNLFWGGLLVFYLLTIFKY